MNPKLVLFLKTVIATLHITDIVAGILVASIHTVTMAEYGGIVIAISKAVGIYLSSIIKKGGLPSDDTTFVQK